MASKHFLKVVRMVPEIRSMNVPISCFHRLFSVSLSYMVTGLLCVTPLSKNNGLLSRIMSKDSWRSKNPQVHTYKSYKKYKDNVHVDAECSEYKKYYKFAGSNFGT
jgi:hypothetical protein